MEHFFKPARCLPIEPYQDYTEVRLAVSVEEFLNHSWDWSALKAFFTGDEGEMWKIMWITEGTFIWLEDENTGVHVDLLEDYVIQGVTFTAPSGETYELSIARNIESASLSAGASSIFWHAMKTSNCVKLRLEHWSSKFGLCSGPALSQFLEASPSLELLEFIDFDFEEAHCRAFMTIERTGLEVTFQECSFDARGAKDTFIEWFRHSQVVTKLENCTMVDSIISALSGNSSVKSLSIDAAFTGWYGNSHIRFAEWCSPIRSLALALPGNQGIENLRASQLDETWRLLLRALWAHPRIQSISLTFNFRMSAATKTEMMNAVLRLAQCNTVVHTIDLPDDAKDEEFFQNSILPRLAMNRNLFEDQRQALTRADPSIRGQLLGRALYVVRYNPDLLFRFLSDNVPAFVRSDEDVNIAPSG
jgi:hypothetical protein